MAYRGVRRRVGLHRQAGTSATGDGRQTPEHTQRAQVYNKRRSHWNGKRIEPPPWLARLDAAARSRPGPCAPCVVVAHPARDYGPATKLVGAVEALRRDPELLEKAGGDREDAVVVAADDDHEWEPFALATLLHVGFSSSSAPVGYDAAKTVWTYYSYPFPRGRPVADAVCVAQAGDMLAAPLSLFGELERWGRELLPGGGLPSCFFVDDLFFAAYAAYHRSTVYTHPWRRWLFREARRPRPISPFRSRRWRRRGAASPRRRLTYASHGVVQRSRSGGSGRASPRSSPARRAAARRRRCSCATPTASRWVECASGTRRTAGASSRRSAGGRAAPTGIRACSGIL